MAGNTIVLKKVTKIFGEGQNQVVAVDALDLNIETGRMMTLLGPSGCGKTTTLRMVAGFEVPSSGDVFIGAEQMNNVPPNKRDTAMVFQSYGLFPHMTVFENVAYGLKIRKLSRKEIRKRVMEVLELTGMSGLEKRAPQQLSGGQQQRVALSRAIVVRPKVLLFDEPLSNLDAKLRVEMRAELSKLQKQLSITSLYVTHDQEEAMSISDELCVMHEGKAQHIGTPTDVYARPSNRFVADFIGLANFLQGRITQINGQTALVQLLNTQLEVPMAQHSHSNGDSVDVLVRPEAVDLLEPGQGDMDGTIQFMQYTGAKVSYEIELVNRTGLSVEVVNPQEHGLRSPGETVGVQLHRHSLHLLPKEA